MAARALLATALCSLLYSAAGQSFYPTDHWSYVTKLTPENFDATVKAAVDADKTLFSPSWNSVTALFKDNEDVAFGDVNLSESPVRGEHNPGMGGWPTIKYFNKATGYAGAHYEKKTDMAVCDELGPKHSYLQEFVEEAGRTSLCSVATGKGCSERETAFAAKWRSRSAGEVAKEVERLAGMKDASMKPDLAAWLRARLAVLKQIRGAADEL